MDIGLDGDLGEVEGFENDDELNQFNFAAGEDNFNQFNELTDIKGALDG